MGPYLSNALTIIAVSISIVAMTKYKLFQTIAGIVKPTKAFSHY